MKRKDKYVTSKAGLLRPTMGFQKSRAMRWGWHFIKVLLNVEEIQQKVQ